MICKIARSFVHFRCPNDFITIWYVFYLNNIIIDACYFVWFSYCFPDGLFCGCDPSKPMTGPFVRWYSIHAVPNYQFQTIHIFKFDIHLLKLFFVYFNVLFQLNINKKKWEKKKNKNNLYNMTKQRQDNK